MSSRCTFLLVILVSGCFAGCVRPGSFANYIEYRRQDLIDVAHVDLTMMEAGAVLYMGPMLIGCNYRGGKRWKGASTTRQYGLGGTRTVSYKGIAAGVFFATVLGPSLSWRQEWEHDRGQNKKAPSYSATGFSIGAYHGLGVELDLFELVDFIAGIFCLDISKDDRPPKSGFKLLEFLKNVDYTGIVGGTRPRPVPG